MLFTLNEWVFHDLLGQNGDDAFRDTAGFLISFAVSNDRLVIPNEERWKWKAFQLMELSHPLGRDLSKLFHGLLRNPNRAFFVTDEEEAPPISQELQEQTPPEDLYLVLAYVATDADLLVTTDEDLHSVLAEHDEVNCRMRNDFLTSYMAGDSP